MNCSKWSVLFYLYNSKTFLYSKIPNKTQSEARCCGILFLINKISLKKNVRQRSIYLSSCFVLRSLPNAKARCLTLAPPAL